MQMTPASENQGALDLLAGVAIGVMPPDDGPARDLLALDVWPDKLTARHVEILREMTQLHRRMEHQFGGYACRAPALAYVSWAERLLSRPRPDAAVETGLYSALAELHNVVGWMEHDLNANTRARWHFARACFLAARSGDRAALADSHYRLGRVALTESTPEDALRFFQLGLLVSQDADIASLSGVLHANEAWAYAYLGDVDQVQSSLALARRELNRVEEGTIPASTRFSASAADVNGLTGVIFNTLGRHPQHRHHAPTALKYATLGASVRGPEAARSYTFDLISIATAHVLDHDRAAAQVAVDRALAAAASVGSARVVDRLNTWRVLAAQNGWTDDADDVGARINRLAGPG
jgi:tetratricopeptide (TPR) repeat protein